MTKFTSNSKEVLDNIPEELRAADIKEIDLSSDSIPETRALGIRWKVADDVFSFKVALEEKPATRRGILATICSVFDPLGMAAPVMLRGKRLLRQICEENIDWDANVSEELKREWKKFRDELSGLRQLKIGRSLIDDLTMEDMEILELHHFSDGAKLGYGQCSYLRAIAKDGRIIVKFVIGKSRVVPKEEPTTPRIELTAALTSVRVASAITREIDLPIQKSVFWTDSKVVLGYIANEEKDLSSMWLTAYMK